MPLMLVLQVIMADLCAEEIDKIKKHGKRYASRLIKSKNKVRGYKTLDFFYIMDITERLLWWNKN